MPVEIVTMEDCASNYGVYKVPSSKPNEFYTVHFGGSEGPASCECPAYRYSRDKTCKHIRKVYDEACLYNPQWKEGKHNPTMKPESYTYSRFTGHHCKFCGGPMVPVRRAV